MRLTIHGFAGSTHTRNTEDGASSQQLQPPDLDDREDFEGQQLFFLGLTMVLLGQQGSHRSQQTGGGV